MIYISALLISICVITLTSQSFFTKSFNIKCPKGKYTYSAIKIIFALLFFVLTTKNISIGTEILPYSAAFATTYSLATVTTLLALKTGSLAITALVMSYSLIIPTAYGLIFNNEALSQFKIIGLAFLVVSLFLIRAKSEKSDVDKFSLKWLIYVSIAFVSNGFCSVIQDAQGKKFSGEQDGNFMIAALGFGLIALIICSLIFERKDITEAAKKGFLLAAGEGLFNGATNFLVMVILAIPVATSVFFPALSACQIIITFAISLVLFKEKFIPRQIIGLFCGIVALVFLNL